MARLLLEDLDTPSEGRRALVAGPLRPQAHAVLPSLRLRLLQLPAVHLAGFAETLFGQATLYGPPFSTAWCALHRKEGEPGRNISNGAPGVNGNPSPFREHGALRPNRMTSKQKVGWIGRLVGLGYGKGTLGLEPDRRCRLRCGLVVGEVHRGLSDVWPPWVFCTIMAPGVRDPLGSPSEANL